MLSEFLCGAQVCALIRTICIGSVCVRQHSCSTSLSLLSLLLCDQCCVGCCAHLETLTPIEAVTYNNGTLSYFWQFRKSGLTIVTYRWPIRTTGHTSIFSWRTPYKTRCSHRSIINDPFAPIQFTRRIFEC